MEILDKLNDCHSTQNHPQLGACLSFEYLGVYCRHVIVEPFWQIELVRHAEHFRHVLEVHSVFYQWQQKSYHHPVFWHVWSKRVKQQPVYQYFHPLMMTEEEQVIAHIPRTIRSVFSSFLIFCYLFHSRKGSWNKLQNMKYSENVGHFTL